jgi:hypothetical protein
MSTYRRLGAVRTAAVRRASCLAALLLLLAIPATGEEAAAPGDVPRVTNGAEPAEGIRTLQLEELWRRGGFDDEELLFGIVNRVLVDDARNVYLLDAQLSEVKVISPEGELVKTLGREGEGPGEFRNPTDMAFLPDGTLGVAQAFPGKVIKLGLDNTPAGVWTIGDPAAGNFYIVRALRSGGGNVVLGGTEQSIDQAAGIVERQTFLSSLGEDGLRRQTYASKTMTMKFQEIEFDELKLIDGPDRRFDVGPDGRVVAAVERNGYQVKIFAPDGTLERIFTRAYEPWVRDERAAGIWTRILTTLRDQQAPQAPVHVEPTEPDVEFLRVAPDGRIWILTSRAMWDPPADAFTQFDVFGPDGTFAEQVRIAVAGDPQQDMVFFAGESLVFMVTGFWDAALSRFGGASGAAEDEEEAEPMTVICYRIL